MKQTNTSRGKMDRTAYSLARKVINSGGTGLSILNGLADLPDDLGSSTSFRDSVALGLNSNCFLSSDHEHLKVLSITGRSLLLDFEATQPKYRVVFHYCVINSISEEYDTRKKSISISSEDSDELNIISSLLLDEVELPRVEDYSDNNFTIPNYFNGYQGLTNALVLGSIMNLFLNRFGHRPPIQEEPCNVRSKGVLYCVVVDNDDMVKMLGWDWFISEKDVFCISSPPREFKCDLEHLFIEMESDSFNREEHYQETDIDICD